MLPQPSTDPPHRVLVGKIPTALPTRRHVVALTFDAGGNAAAAPRILETLRKTNTVATFFLTGRWAQLYPRLARQIGARYPIGNHTFHHFDLTKLSEGAVQREVVWARTAITRTAGRPPVPLFRFPYGASNAASLRVVNRLGYTAVGWTVDTLGWEGATRGVTVALATQRVIAHLSPGAIILMHVGSSPNGNSTLDTDALDDIIRAIRHRGYSFVTLPPYLP